MLNFTGFQDEIIKQGNILKKSGKKRTKKIWRKALGFLEQFKKHLVGQMVRHNNRRHWVHDQKHNEQQAFQRVQFLPE